MGKIILFILLGSTLSVSLFRPWIGVVAYYGVAVMSPQVVWPWVFSGTRISFLISAATILGFLGRLFAKKFDFSPIKQRQNTYMAILWLTIIVSYLFSPYSAAVYSYRQGSQELFLMMNKIFLFYFISIPLIDSRKKYYYLILAILFIVIYYTYWGNDQYFSGIMRTKRLTGPGPGGLYYDENKFSMIFVASIPFLYFMGNYYKNKIIKYCLWAVIPFAWHVVFLSGSMGGLLSLGVVSLFLAVRSKNKILIIVIPLALLLSFMFQGGDYLKEKASTEGGNVTKVSSAQQRIQSWSVATQMITDYPLTGVGFGNYLSAWPDYSEDEEALVAHNTFFQLTAECGVIAGLMYVLILLHVVWSNVFRSKIHMLKEHGFFRASQDSITGGIIGFYTCAMFVNFATYEIYYYLLLLNAIHQNLVKTALDQESRSVQVK